MKLNRAFSVLEVVEPGKDGVFRHVDGLCRFLIKAGVDVSLAYSDVRSSSQLDGLIDVVRNNGGNLLNLRVGGTPEGADFRASAALHRMIASLRPDVVHAHSSKAGLLVRASAFLHPYCRFFYTPNAYFGMARRRPLRNLVANVMEAVLGRVGDTINVSLDEADFARSTLRVADHQRVVIPNAVDLERFQPATAARRKDARSLFGLPEDALVVGVMARKSFQKDLDTLYEAFGQISLRFPQLWLLHVGNGDMHRKTCQLGISNRLLRIDYLSETHAFYHALDAFALSSRYEGLSFAILEALAANLPLVITDVPGNHDFTTYGLSHLWTSPPEDPRAFARALASWLKDRTLGRPINHREIAERRHASEHCFGQVLRQYEIACGAKDAVSEQPTPPALGTKPQRVLKPRP